MKDEATPEQLAMARRICASVCGSDAVGRVAAREFLRGDADDESDMRIALAAIIETTELAYKLAADHVDQCDDTAVGRARNATARDIYEALRSGDHLKGQDHG